MAIDVLLMTMHTLQQAKLSSQTQNKKKSKYDRLHTRIQELFAKFKAKSIHVEKLFSEVKHVHVFN